MEKTFEEKLAEARAAVAAVSPQEANERKQNNPEIVFIDPRDESDIQSTTGIIPGALNLPLGKLSETGLPEELAERSHTIITACQGGPMGAIAAHALKKLGFENVQFMDGGTQGWLDAGYATVR